MATTFSECFGQQFSPNVVVSKDGDGNYETIGETVKGIPDTTRAGRYVIYVKSGVYQENVLLSRSNVTLVGDGIGKTIVSSMLNQDDGYSITDSAALTVTTDNFIAKYLTFQNTSGPHKHQAVALTSNGDKCAYHNCSFIGYQDTLYVKGGRQFFRDCNIYGTIDFIFGDAAVVLQNCNIKLRKPLRGQEIVVTAQGREDGAKNTGISIHGCSISCSGNFDPGSTTTKCYLGRPWKKYSRTVVMGSFIDKAIDPSGWLDMNGNGETAECLEYGNRGPGAQTGRRVGWPGFRVLSGQEAEEYTVGMFIDGNQWLPSTGVPFVAGL